MVRKNPPEVLGLGPLEAEVMGVLWRRGPSLAAEVRQALNRRREEQLAHTTVVNVLTNLERKQVVDHVVEGKAYRFAASLDEDALRSRQAKHQARELFRLFDDAAVSAIVGEVRADLGLVERFRQLLDADDTPGATEDAAGGA